MMIKYFIFIVRFTVLLKYVEYVSIALCPPTWMYSALTVMDSLEVLIFTIRQTNKNYHHHLGKKSYSCIIIIYYSCIIIIYYSCIIIIYYSCIIIMYYMPSLHHYENKRNIIIYHLDHSVHHHHHHS